MADPATMGIKEMKAYLARKGVSIVGITEKSELRAKVQETMDAAPNNAIETIRTRTETVAGLTSVVVDNCRGDPDVAVVVLHGFGANEQDLAPIGEMMLKGLSIRARFFFPRAPITLMANSYAWWPLDMARLMQLAATMQFDVLCNDTPNGLASAREHMDSYIDAVKTTTGLGMDRVVLGGFSQGSMLATDSCLRQPEGEGPAALLVWSGFVMCRDEWASLPARPGLRVLQSHGTMDPVLPFAGATWMTTLLKEKEMDVSFEQFQGAHTVSPGAVKASMKVIEDVIAAAK